MNDYCAAIDFGTNTARLLIAEFSSNGIVPVRVEREVVRLGGGFTDEFGLSTAAQERGLACLRRFSKIISEYNINQVYASATSAVRDAVNGAAFVDAVSRETGIFLSTICGDTEARLTLKGVFSGLDSENKKLVVLDVGGGSTEFTVSSYGSPVFIKSMPIGVVRLTEGFCESTEMIQRIRGVITELEKELSTAGILSFGGYDLVGTAGTATTIAAIKLKMVVYDYRTVNNLTVTRADIEEIYQRLCHLTPQERLSITGLEKGREDLIIAGLLIIITVMEIFNFTQLKVSDFGLLEGLALSGKEPDLLV